MARTLLKIAASTIFIMHILSLLVTVKSQEFEREMSKQEMGIKREKLIHLHFYAHNILIGKNPNAVQVAQAAMTNTSATSYGRVIVFDDPLTIGPNITSKLIGRAQGMYASAAQEQTAFLMVFNCVFVEGKYKGSTLSILGRYNTAPIVKEMAIVGGSGILRYARGSAEAKLHTLDVITRNVVVEYDVYVSYY